ncbi:MAG: polyprenyl diphosphate synthase [Thermodesulfovibrionales bacterium]|nr:polyprenyl diphosphate synthase [Thermodesulfovibrionales bacterium]
MSIPLHIGIIMDGNGRWAEMRGLPRFEGHRRGVERAMEITEAALGTGIKVLSLYAFSIENWRRPEDEISVIMSLLESTLKGKSLNFMKEGIKFKVIGNRDRLSDNTREIVESVERLTENNDKFTLQCALSYSGRDEIIRAVKRAISIGLSPEDISEERISQLLDTSGIPDLDLIIRTSGEQRLSNFLLWQSAYSEFYFTSTLWPDFTKEELLEAIYNYQTRDRRFGKLTNGAVKCT